MMDNDEFDDQIDNLYEALMSSSQDSPKSRSERRRHSHSASDHQSGVDDDGDQEWTHLDEVLMDIDYKLDYDEM